jgi:hypothetical protein
MFPFCKETCFLPCAAYLKQYLGPFELIWICISDTKNPAYTHIIT